MAQDAELKLKVSLDLAFFRQELSTIGAQLGGQSLQLNIQFNKKSIADQYRLLGRYLEAKTFKVKVESPTLDVLVQKVSTFKKNLVALGNEKIDLAVNVVSNIDEVRKSIKDRLPSVGIATKLNEPTNVDDFIREVGKKVKGQVEKSYMGGGIPIATKLETPGTTSLIKSLQENLNNQDPLRAKVSTTPSIIGDDVKAFRDAVKEKFSGIVVKIKAELEGAGQGASEQGGRNFSQAALRKLGQDIKPLYRAAADAGLVEFNESIANNVQSIAKELSNVSGDLIEGLLNGLKSKDPQIKAAAKNLGEALISSIKSILGIASPSKVFKAIGEDVGKGFELGAIASMNRAFDALEKSLQQRLGKLQAMMQPQASRRGAFPFVAKSGPIESKVLMEESASLARQIDQVRAQLAQTQQRRQSFREGALSFQRETLAQSAGRMLPAGVSAAPKISAQDIVTQNFYKSMQDAQRMLQENFAANSYLPRATRMFADSMQQASQGIKAIAGARAPIAALPSAQMIEQRKFQSAIMQAIKTDMQNALRQQMQGRMLPAAGQSSYRSPQQKEQQRFQEAINKAAAIDAEKAAIFAARQARTQAGEMLRQTRAQMRVPALPAAGQSSFGLMKNRELQSSLANIGTFGRQETGGVQGIIASGKGSIFEKLKASAIAFAQNAPTVIKYLNLFRPERISVSDLPSEKEGPGQFVQRISQQLKEGLFGPGTRPAQSRQFFEFGQGAQLPGMPLQRALPPIGGSGGGDRVRGMGQPPQRGGAIVPFAPSTKLPENYLAQRDLINSLRGADKFLSQSKIPLSGAIRELGDEFGNAVKQVLLFGTAYKALAFITSIPGQAFEASKALQTFENQLIAITGSAANADRAFGFVESLANRFNVPLDSARQGFVRLYASMAPAGFSSEQIENLFTGITKASATLGLSADKVDRVTYAFSQMASKGQLMSEEVSGQLGDVIPGALSIMAEAARMDIATFKKAMEDGAFVGKAFEQVMSNVPIVLENKFGKGAAGAANTLQGAMNALTTSTTKFYESFEPIVKLGAITVFPVLTETLKQATAAIKAFSSVMEGSEGAANMLTGSARNIYDILLQLREIFSALAITVKNLAPTFAILGQSILQVLNQVSKFVNTPLGGFIANVVVQAALLTSGLQLLAKLGFGQAIAALINFVFNTKAAVYQMKELIKTSALAKFGLISLGASVVITSIFSVVSALNAVYEKMLDIQRGAKGAAQAIASMSQTEATVKARSIEGQIALLQRFYGQAKKFGDLPVEASAAEVTAMAAAGGTPGQAFTGPLVDQKTGAYGRGTITPTMVPAAIQALEGQLAAARKQAEPVTVQTAELGDVEIEAGKEKNEKKKKLVSELAKIYKQELDNYLVYIDMDTNISDRQKELQKAAISWQYEHAIAKEEYNEKIKEQNTKDIANLTEYLAEQKRLFKLEQDQIDARYQAIVTKPLREMLGEDRKAQIQLQASTASLASGKEEMTRVEQRESEIKQALLGLNDKQKEALAPLIKLVLSEAKAVDELTAKQKEQNDALRERQELQKRVKETLSSLRDEIELLRGITEEEQKRLKIAKEFKGASSEELNRIYDLEKVRDNIKAVRETIDGFVTDTSSDYKGFLKEVISGEDAVDSLKKFQEALKDRTLTIFLDFAMAPVEKFFKEGLSKFAIEKFFPKGTAENMPEETKPSTTPVEAQDKNTTATNANTKALEANTAAMTGTGGAVPTPGQTTAAGTSGGFLTGTAALQTLPFNGNTDGMLQNLPFPTGNTSILSNLGIDSEELSASISKNADAFSSQLSKIDTSVFESATALSDAGTELGKEGAAGKKWQESLGQAVGGLGMAAGAVMGIVAGINQVKEGGTSNVLGGIGMIASMAGSLLGSFSSLGGLFGGGGASSIVQGVDVPIAQMPAGMQFANGGVAIKGFRAFANGGMVSGPTLGLVGEGKYNEAIVPLPDGKSIPVQFGGGSSRDLLSKGSSKQQNASPVLSMSFQTTKFGDKEYVDIGQLQAAMAETRRLAAREGAAQGSQLALNRLRNSPNTRRQLGLG